MNVYKYDLHGFINKRTSNRIEKNQEKIYKQELEKGVSSIKHSKETFQRFINAKKPFCK